MSLQGFNISRDNLPWQLLLGLWGGITCALVIGAALLVGIKLAFYGVIAAAFIFAVIVTKRPKELLLAAFVLTIPIDVVKVLTTPTAFSMSGHLAALDISLAEIPFLGLLLYWLVRASREKAFQVPPSSLHAPAIAVIAWSAVSMLNASELSLSIFQIWELVKLYIIFLCLSSLLRTRREIKLVVALLAVAVLVQGLITIGFSYYLNRMAPYLKPIPGYQILVELPSIPYITSNPLRASGTTAGWRVEGTSLIRAFGTVGDMNSQALYFSMLLPLLLIFVFTRLWWAYRGALALIFLVGAGGLLATFSRGGLLSFALGVAVAIMLSLERRLITFKMFAAVGLFAAVAALLIFISPLRVPLGARMEAMEHIVARVELIDIALRIIRANPLVGVGINNYAEVAEQYDPTRAAAGGGSFLYELEMEPPIHNTFLLIAAELGIPGLILYLWLLAAASWEMLCCVRCGERLLVALGVGLLSSLVAVVASMNVDPVVIAPILRQFWLLLALAAAGNHLSRRESPSQGFEASSVNPRERSSPWQR